jgi:tetratricopeptide (TPR) repeat protein
VVIKPMLAEGHHNLALVLRRSGQLEAAEARFLEALRVEPGLAIAHNGYANLLVQVGRTDEAMVHYRAAIENDPKLAEAHFNLALALTRMGEVEEAEAHYLRALTHRPDLVPALANLGGIYLQAGRVDEAVTLFLRALSLRPDFQAVRNNLRQIAWVYATAAEPSARNGARAVELAETVNRTHPEDPETLATLAAAYAEVGRFQEAARAAERAVGLTQSGALLVRLQQHLEQYRNGRPVRER